MKKKLLIWSDSPTVPTGFGNVAKNLFSELYKNFDVAILGINEFGLHKYDNSKYFIYPTDRTDMLGVQRMPLILKDFNPDIVLLFQDIFNMEHVMPLIKQWNPKVPIVAYFPIDGNPVNRAWQKAFETPDKLITYTEWGIRSIKEVFPNLNKDISYLYHGVDTAVFKPLPSSVRRKLKEEHGWDNKFMILSVNRFQPRKVLPLLIRAHGLFTKGYKICDCGNVYLASKTNCDLNGCDVTHVKTNVSGHNDSLLYLHANAQERMMGPGMANSIQAHLLNSGFKDEDVNKTIAANGKDIYSEPLSEAEINMLYNIADLNVSATLGEGVGLSLIEASAVGTTSIAPNNSAIPEMLGDTGHIIPNIAHINIAMDNAHMRPIMSMEKYLEAVEIEYQKWVANGRQKVVNKDAINRVDTLFDWDEKRAQMLGWLQAHV